MCHYTYTLFICCDDPKEYDGVHIHNIAFCNHCPLSADNTLYDGDFFHCPYVTAKCLGASAFICLECSRTFWMQDNNDDVDRDKDPDDDFSEHSEAESDGGMFNPGE